MAAEGASPQAVWQQAAQIDDRGVVYYAQNPAYKPDNVFTTRAPPAGGSLVESEVLLSNVKLSATVKFSPW